MAVTDLELLLREMRPELVEGRFVFVELPGTVGPDIEVLASVREAEGQSAVIAEADALRLGLAFDFVAAWITLRVESSLAAIGLTAAVSARLTEAGISCNVIAGLRHDHLLVPADRAADALAALERLSAGG